jgi:hypothetical protein
MSTGIILSNRRPRLLNGPNKVIHREGRLLQFFSVDFAPGLFHRPFVAGRTRRELGDDGGIGFRLWHPDLIVEARRDPSDAGQVSNKLITHTSLKWVALSTFRTGCIKASRTTTEISEPE